MTSATQVPREDPARELLRHIVATLAYRAGKTVRDAPPSFAGYQASETTRTPAQILAHMGDLVDWALSIASGRQQWRDSKPLPWPQEVSRFFAALSSLDAYLASENPLHGDIGKLFQGGLADALTHTGQIAMLRRMAGCPVRGENYYQAHIEKGRVGPDQAAPVREFD
ncbi:MAG TPA: hypothetical protein VMH05_15190 [Bryobacteraceae bacterium]|nr:hypothetical protein [Bryobacteraceae bacterium]